MTLPTDIQTALSKLEPSIRDAFLQAIAQITSNAQLAVIEDAIRRGNIEAAVAALRLDATFYAPLDRAISEAFYQGGVLALAGLPRLTDPFPVGAWSLALMAAIHAQRNGSSDTSET